MKKLFVFSFVITALLYTSSAQAASNLQLNKNSNYGGGNYAGQTDRPGGAVKQSGTNQTQTGGWNTSGGKLSARKLALKFQDKIRKRFKQYQYFINKVENNLADVQEKIDALEGNVTADELTKLQTAYDDVEASVTLFKEDFTDLQKRYQEQVKEFKQANASGSIDAQKAAIKKTGEYVLAQCEKLNGRLGNILGKYKALVNLIESAKK